LTRRHELLVLARNCHMDELPQVEELKVYVGGLPFTLDEAALRKDFEECGEIEKLECPRRDDDSFKGFAFVTYKTKAGFEAALKFDGDDYAGRTLRVKPAGKGKGEGKGEGKGDGKGKGNKENEVYIGGLPYEATEEELMDHFKDCGPIASVRVPTDPATGSSKGFAFLAFEDMSGVDAALQLNETEFGGRWLRVRPSGDGGKGKGGGGKGDGKGKGYGKDNKGKGGGKDKGKSKGKDKGKGYY